MLPLVASQAPIIAAALLAPLRITRRPTSSMPAAVVLPHLPLALAPLAEVHLALRPDLHVQPPPSPRGL